MPSRQQEEYRQMLKALMDARCVVLSLLNQLGLNHYKESDLQRLVRQCALDLVGKKPVIRAALGTVHKKRVGHKSLPSKSKEVVSTR